MLQAIVFVNNFTSFLFLSIISRDIPVFKERADDLVETGDFSEESIVEDIFRTEFHMRLLWGSNGALASSEERHGKFEKVILAMANICQNIEKTIFKA